MFKIILLLALLQAFTCQYCVSYKSVQDSLYDVDSNYNLGGHVWKHINCAAADSTSFYTWKQMLGGSRLNDCLCQSGRS
jgi:hypothetical protein